MEPETTLTKSELGCGANGIACQDASRRSDKFASLYRNEVEYKPRRVWVLPAAGWSTRVRVLDLGLHATSGERSGRAALDGGKQAAASQPARDHGALAVPVYARVAGESCRQKHGQHSMAGAHPPGCTPLSWMEPDRPW